jgi:hypothetical protein
MNVIVPLTNLGFLPEFYYPTIMQNVHGRTVLEHSVDSLSIQGQYHFIIRWEDHTKFSIGNYINASFPGAIVHITRDRIHGDAEAVLKVPAKEGPLVIFDAKSVLLWNSGAFLSRISQSKADMGVTVFPNHNRKYPHIKVGGYDRNDISRIVHDRSNFAVSGLYYFNDARHYYKAAPQIIKDELEMEYREIGLDIISNYFLNDGARAIYHRTGVRRVDSIDSLSRFEL